MNVLERFKFGTHWSSIVWHPFSLSRTAIFEEFQQLKLYGIQGNVLDVGCGSMPYRSLFPKAKNYDGLEIDQPRNQALHWVKYRYDGLHLPFSDGAYSVIFCSQVLEHSFDPEVLISEFYRVLRSDGFLVLSIPFIWPEHEQPYDSQRFSSFGIIHRLKKAGFGGVTVRKTNPGLSCLMQLSIEWMESLGRRLPNLLAMPWRLLTLIPYSLMNLIGCIYRNLPPVRCGNSKAELYLDLVVTARKP